MPDSNTRSELEYDGGKFLTNAEEAEQARKGREEWRRVVNGLLDNTEEFNGRLNDRICDEFEWAVDIENILSGGSHVMDLYSKGLLAPYYEGLINNEAKTLASIIVGADHE
jgi:hypothetical protein